LKTSFSFIVIETHTKVAVKILIKSQTMPQSSARISRSCFRREEQCKPAPGIPVALNLNRRVVFAKDRIPARRQQATLVCFRTERSQPTRKKAVASYGLFNFIFCDLPAVGAYADAYSRRAEANAATVLVTPALDIAFAGGVAV
jgi:hypothetical protein